MKRVISVVAAATLAALVFGTISAWSAGGTSIQVGAGGQTANVTVGSSGSASASTQAGGQSAQASASGSGASATTQAAGTSTGSRTTTSTSKSNRSSSGSGGGSSSGSSEQTATGSAPAVCAGKPLLVWGTVSASDSMMKTLTLSVIRSSNKQVKANNMLILRNVVKLNVNGKRRLTLTGIPVGAFVSASAVTCSDGSGYQAKTVVVHTGRRGHLLEEKAEKAAGKAFHDADGDGRR